MFRSYSVSAAFICALFIAPASSYAACNTRDLEGTWHTVFKVDGGGENLTWDVETYLFDKTGVFTSEGQQCIGLDFGDTAPQVCDDFLTGQFSVTEDCQIIGTIVGDTPPNPAIIRGSVNADVTVMIGVGWFEGVPNGIATFTATKASRQRSR